MKTRNDKKTESGRNEYFADEKYQFSPSIVLSQFPQEFKRNWLGEFNLRFNIILVITSFIEIGLLLILMNYAKKYTLQVDVIKIQQQFAHLLLKDAKMEKLSTSETTTEPAGLTSIPTLEDISSEIPEALAKETPIGSETAPVTEYFTHEQRLVSDRLGYLSQKAGKRTESQFANALAREVNQKGLLVYLTDEKNAVADDHIIKILSSSDESEKHLLASMDKVSREKYQNAFSKYGNLYLGNDLKGSKTSASFSDEISMLMPLAKIEITDASKNVELEYNDISNISTTKRSRNTRTAEHVTQVLLSHNKAIQDCYKQVIKSNPDLKGKVVLRISVNPTGSVENAQILESTLENDRVLRCLVNRIRRWQDFGACDPELGTIGYKQTYIFGY